MDVLPVPASEIYGHTSTNGRLDQFGTASVPYRSQFRSFTTVPPVRSLKIQGQMFTMPPPVETLQLLGHNYALPD
ncbi:hypothetical protein RRG08_061634 [Elysia crispata]|uniref:Uncharacterized protein n=1 Tax=Elysia crispata TaxID=231223 RepID=A0AAE1APM5_9GAST|nr:hypothetical protein RRG08_061634 [Elysia crispata]